MTANRRGIIAAIFLSAVLAVSLFPGSAGAATSLSYISVKSDGVRFTFLRARDTSTAANRIVLLKSGKQLVIDDKAGIEKIADGCTQSSANTAVCPLDRFNSILLETGSGNDRVRPKMRYPSLTEKQIFGTKRVPFVIAALGAGRDVYTAGTGTESVLGQAGPDTIRLGGSSDFAKGGGGADKIQGGGARDFLFGDTGNDLMLGGGGRDYIEGELGDDTIYGGPGNKDLMIGGPGRDRCYGSEPNDLVIECEVVRLLKKR